MNKEIPLVPQNIEAEIAVLGSIVLNESLIVKLKDELNEDDFYDERNKTIYKAMLALYNDNKNVDLTSVISYLETNSKLEAIGGVDYLSSVFTSNYTSINIDTYVSLVRESSLKRLAIKRLNLLMQEGYDPTINANNYLSHIEEVVFNLSKNRKTAEFTDIESVTQRVSSRIQEATSEVKNKITGITTGYTNLDNVTLGFQKEQLIILAARPAMGKSALAMNLAVNVASYNKNGHATVAVFSLEMGMDQLVERMIACESNIHLSNIRTGNMDGTETRKFFMACKKLAGLNIYFDDSSTTTIEDIRAKCRKQKASPAGLDFVVIDYLQLIDGSSSGAKSRQEEVSKISRGLKMMARELQIPVLALAQLSREVEKRDDKKPIMADLRDSGSIEQDADIVTFLYREDYYKKDKDKEGEQPISEEAILNIAKNRSGSAGVDLDFVFQGRYSKFKQIEKGENHGT